MKDAFDALTWALEKLGIPLPPAFLAVVIAVSAVAALVSAARWLSPAWRWAVGSRWWKQMGIALIVVAVLLGSAGAALLFFGSRQDKQAAAAGGQSPAPEAKVHVACQLASIPKVVPPTGRFWALQLWPLPLENGGGGLGEHVSRDVPGSPMVWPEGFDKLNVYRCAITNYEAAPIFNLTTSLHLVFQQSLRDPQQPHAQRSGATVLERPWPITVDRIDAGADHPFEFFIWNNSANFVQAELPVVATFQLAGEREPREFNLIRPNGYRAIMTFGPGPDAAASDGPPNAKPPSP